MDWRNPHGFVEWTILFGSIFLVQAVTSLFAWVWFFKWVNRPRRNYMPYNETPTRLDL